MISLAPIAPYGAWREAPHLPNDSWKKAVPARKPGPPTKSRNANGSSKAPAVGCVRRPGGFRAGIPAGGKTRAHQASGSGEAGASVARRRIKARVANSDFLRDVWSEITVQ